MLLIIYFSIFILCRHFRRSSPLSISLSCCQKWQWTIKATLTSSPHCCRCIYAIWLIFDDDFFTTVTFFSSFYSHCQPCVFFACINEMKLRWWWWGNKMYNYTHYTVIDHHMTRCDVFCVWHITTWFFFLIFLFFSDEMCFLKIIKTRRLSLWKRKK